MSSTAYILNATIFLIQTSTHKFDVEMRTENIFRRHVVRSRRVSSIWNKIYFDGKTFADILRQMERDPWTQRNNDECCKSHWIATVTEKKTGRCEVAIGLSIIIKFDKEGESLQYSTRLLVPDATMELPDVAK